MYQKAKPLFLICETPLHAGSGSDLGIVDLPIQRERHTSFPKIEASSLKGALREAMEETCLKNLEYKKDKEGKPTKEYTNESKEKTRELLKKLNRVFGYDQDRLRGFSKEEMKVLFGEGKIEFAGAIGFTDARLLLFPIKSMKGVFAWVTCPRILKQLEREMKLVDNGFSITNLQQLSNPQENKCYLLCDSISDLTINQDKIILEEYAFTVSKKELKVGEITLQTWLANTFFKANSYWHKKAQKSIVVLSDNDFKDFVNLSTEVITRTKIDNEKGVVVGGALFTEEYLPTESILYSLVMAHDEFSDRVGKLTVTKVLEFMEDLPEVIQVGGNATLGKGMVRTVYEKTESQPQPQETQLENAIANN